MRASRLRPGAAAHYHQKVRYFFRRGEPDVNRILLVESGSRHLLEGILPALRENYGEVPVDLVTCYAGLPAGLDPSTTIAYRVTAYRGKTGRTRLYRELAANGYSIVGIVCSAEAVMFKWKCALALRVPAKVFVLNENGDYFWFDYAHWPAIRHFVLFRMGLAGAGAVRTIARLFLFPFTFFYLLLYATAVHSRRALRKGF